MRKRRRRYAGIIPQWGELVHRGAWWAGKHSLPIAVVGIAAAVGAAVWYGASRSDAFRVTAVQLPLNSTLKIPESVIGHNLWAVDLDAIAEGLKRQQPFLKRVRVIRVMPNTLRVETVERTPVAQVKLSTQWYAVDAGGFILGKPSPTPWEALVILKGVDHSRTPLKPGREQANDHLLLALRVVEQLRRSAVLVGRRLTTVDVGNPKQLAFMLDPDVEIRCGDEGSLSHHLERLRTVLRTVSRHQLAVRSIDLRFQEPVVSPRL